MSRADDTNDALVDALVDTYRGLREINRKSAESIATKPIIDGAGVSPLKRKVPGKRLRNWHRAYNHGTTFRQFVRRVASGLTGGYEMSGRLIAQQWMRSKGIKP